MPPSHGGIGTGSVSLSGRGALVDFEWWNHPGKGYMLPATFFAVALRPSGGRGPVRARVLAAPLSPPYDVGGFGLPKDLDAFVMIARKLGYDFDLLKEVRRINEAQKELFVKKIEDQLWNIKDKTIGIWGLAFKPHTDDMRFAPSIDIIQTLQAHGARIKAYDPEATAKAKKILRNVTVCSDAFV